MQDYYAILEVSPTATPAEIKRSYRRLVRKYHPDLNQQAQDTLIKRLNEAYEVLRDPRKRAAYDARRAEALRLRAARQAYLRQQAQMQREPQMTWVEGIIGFVRELRRELRKP